VSETLQQGRGRAWDALARAAAAAEEAGERTLRRELVVFHVDGEACAVPVSRVREIVRLRPITPVPRVPAEVLGVISLRGEIVQVIDLRMRLGAAAAAPTRTTRIVVLHGEEGQVTGLFVDTVDRVLRVPVDELLPPSRSASAFVEALCTQGERFIGLLQLEKVLSIE
jgi:purine-binding chemotaxis protein CheW